MESASPDELDKLINKLDKLQRQFEALDGYGLEARIGKILPEMGFQQEDGDRLVSSFSGGWQMRMGLGKILLQKPDLLLLDEPTNHLDLETIEWLENYLKGLTTPMVIVSHDREFLDRLCTQIVETERGVSTTYLGNYSLYLQQKAESQSAQLSAFERQQKELDKQQAFVKNPALVLLAVPKRKVVKNSLIKSNVLKHRLQELELYNSNFLQHPAAGVKS